MDTIKQDGVASLPTRFNFYGDPGHAWLEVPYSTLVALNIHRQVSEYSYQRNGMVYLEEDCDAVLFVKAYLRHIGKKENDFKAFKPFCVNFEDRYYSSIRDYSHYKNPAQPRG